MKLIAIVFCVIDVLLIDIFIVLEGQTNNESNYSDKFKLKFKLKIRYKAL